MTTARVCVQVADGEVVGGVVLLPEVGFGEEQVVDRAHLLVHEQELRRVVAQLGRAVRARHNVGCRRELVRVHLARVGVEEVPVGGELDPVGVGSQHEGRDLRLPGVEGHHVGHGG